MKKQKISMLATLGMLLAIEIVLSPVLLHFAWNIKIGFSFVPVAVAAVLYGAPLRRQWPRWVTLWVPSCFPSGLISRVLP